MNLVTKEHFYNTSGKTAVRDFYVNDSSAGIPSPYASMFGLKRRNDYKYSLKARDLDFSSDFVEVEKSIALNKKIVASYLDAFAIDNLIVKPEKVRGFLVDNKTLLTKLSKLITSALSEYQNLIENISLRVLGDESGKQDYIFVEFNLIDSVDTDESIEIDDNFKLKNSEFLTSVISFDFV